jgi:HPt (histidine-containing phosphotransfer) domain-containing protein
VDIAQGIAMTGGTMELYKKVLAMFRTDAEERLPLLGQVPAPEALPLFVTQVHALKSALASIGAAELSAQAAALETAGKAADTVAIAGKLPAFADGLAALTAAIGVVLTENLAGGPGGSQAPGGGVTGVEPPLRGVAEDRRAGARGELATSEASFKRASPLLNDLAEALEAQNAAEIDRLLEELLQQPLDKTAQEAAEQISNLVLMAEYGKALEAVRSLPGGDDRQSRPVELEHAAGPADKGRANG